MDNYFQYKDRFPHLEFDTNTGWGWLPPNDEVFDAFNYVKKFVHPKRILEIGYYRGHSTSYLADVFPDAHIVSSSPRHEKWKESHQATQEFGKGGIEIIPVPSPSVIHYLPDIHDVKLGKFDFAFIDGSHMTYDVYSDIHVALRLEIPYMMFDNADQTGVGDAIGWYVAHGCLEKIASFTYKGLSKGKYKDNDLTLFRNISEKIYRGSDQRVYRDIMHI